MTYLDAHVHLLCVGHERLNDEGRHWPRALVHSDGLAQALPDEGLCLCLRGHRRCSCTASPALLLAQLWMSNQWWLF